MAITCTRPVTCSLCSTSLVSSSQPVRFAAVIAASAWIASCHSPRDSEARSGMHTSSTILARRRVRLTREHLERPMRAETAQRRASPVQLAVRATAFNACMALSTPATRTQISFSLSTMVLSTRAASSLVSILAVSTRCASASIAPGVRANASAQSLLDTRLRSARAATADGLSCEEEARPTNAASTPGRLLTSTLFASALAIRFAIALAAATFPSSLPLHTTCPSTSSAPQRPTMASSSVDVLLVSETISDAACAASLASDDFRRGISWRIGGRISEAIAEGPSVSPLISSLSAGSQISACAPPFPLFLKKYLKMEMCRVRMPGADDGPYIFASRVAFGWHKKSSAHSRLDTHACCVSRLLSSSQSNAMNCPPNHSSLPLALCVVSVYFVCTAARPHCSTPHDN
mmetsp:Transcript_10282/g.24122  ORF Transcript_10282/g.24122 Transcript_10282/m.24122 type:complete len:405 (+) Transcript_10282:353-1567(+)